MQRINKLNKLDLNEIQGEPLKWSAYQWVGAIVGAVVVVAVVYVFLVAVLSI